MKRRVAIVVQRCHESVVGGSESLAWQYAKLLSGEFEVEVLTSTAVDYMRWRNVLAEGVSMREGIAIRRFRVEIERERYWFELHHRLLREYAATEGRAPAERIGWRPALQEEFVKFQGPYTPGLTAHLQENSGAYAAVIFCTYLYPTTYFSVRAVPREKRIFVPTLHDEPTAYLPIYADCAREFDHIVWLTRSEREVARRIWGHADGEVVGMAVEQAAAEPGIAWPRPYFLYSGRIEQAKGVDVLLRAFREFRRRTGVKVDLLLTGAKSMRLPWWRRDVRFLGFVDEARKRRLMADAVAFVLPSPYESFSIVAMEAMVQRAPVILNGDCTVLEEHIERSGGGIAYRGFEQLVAALTTLAAMAPNTRAQLGEGGRAYVLSHFETGRVRRALVEIVKTVANGGAATGP